MTIAAKIERWSRLGIDTSVQPPEVIRRTRRVVLATAVVLALGGSALLGAILLGRVATSVVLAGVLLGVLVNTAVLRRGGDLQVGGATVVAAAWVIALLGCIDSGALAHGRIGWMPIVPLLALLALNVRAGRWTAGVVGCTVTLLWGIDAITGAGDRAVWVLFDRLVAVAASTIVGIAFVRLLEQAGTDVQEVRRSLTAEVDTRRRAEEVAVAAGHAKTRFLGNMSHEIRTPMVGIMGMTDLLMGTELTPVQRSYARTLRQSGENLLAIINDILDFVKIDARKLELERVPLRLRAVVEDALELLDPLAEQRGIDLVTRFAPDTAEPILSDPVRIRQILLNLIGNAIKFTHEGHVLVKVEVVVRSSPRRGVKFTVQDTGVGISPAKIDRLFEPFTQADISTSRAYGGTGLGLAICKQLTDLMGGEIAVESTSGEGSTFWFTVPGELAPPLHDAQRVQAPLKDQVVLVASEHAFTREAARDLARYLGARRVDSVWKTQEIPGALADEMMRPDLVLIDARMHQLTPQIWANASEGTVVLLAPVGEAVPAALAEAPDVRIAPIPVREKTFLVALGYADPAADAETPRHTDARVLVAEDVEVNRSVIQALAERLGCRVDLAVDGLEAVELVCENAYDLILMDCHMPEMDGYAATRKIRQLGYDERRLPIIALTANIMPGERERCEAAGMNDYLAKPVGQDQLERCFGRWLAACPGEPATGTPVEPMAGPRIELDDGDTSASPAGSGHGEPPVFDRVATLARLGGNEELLFTIIRSFQEEARTILDDIRDTVGRRDAERLRSGAHKLKGALASIGGEAARDVAARLEKLASAGELEPASPCVERLVDEMARLDGELMRYVSARVD